MSRLQKITSMATGILFLLVFGGCSDDFFAEQQGAHGVDMNAIVEVEIPFGLGRGITSQIVTRSARETDQSGKDSQLSGIMVFVYENNGGDARNDKRISFQLFESPLTSLEGSTGGWIPDETDQTSGYFKLYLPLGDVYIYLIGNATGSFVDFFPDLGDSKLENRQDFLDKVTPRWNGNMFTVDGFLPLAGTVNNSTGACRIKLDDEGKGVITYKKDNDGTEYEILQGRGIPFTEDNSFVLKRLMCKVSMEFKSKEGVKFTPKSYRFCHCAQFIAPSEEGWQFQQYLNTIDTETVTFDQQTPNSFTVYLPENVREYEGVKTDWVFADRDRVKKDENGNNVYEDLSHEGHEAHYDFEFAPKHSTYVEIVGSFEGDNISADTKYLIHLGDFSKSLSEFSLHRDYHYQYTVTVNGVNDIFVEVRGDGGQTPQERNPSVEGIVFEGGARLQLDAHYEQVEMKLRREDMVNGVYIYAQTPFGRVNCKYSPVTQQLEGDYSNEYGSNEAAMTVFKKLLQWVEFKKQSDKGVLAPYEGGGTRMDVFAALDDAYRNTEANDYYTCFVDEYYYASNPVNDRAHVALSDFVNADDRTFSLGSSISYSRDGMSAVASAVYVLQQHSIACFYDLDNTSVTKFGVEIIDEIGDLAEDRLPYGSPAVQTSEVKHGRSNTLGEISNRTDAVDWAKNGFLLNADDSKLVASGGRLKTRSAYLACLTRNRDFNGDGNIAGDELRWYTPARDQMLGLWIGEPALPAMAALYPNATTGLSHLGSKSNYPIYTSTNGSNRVIWAEEGCSFGDVGASGDKGYVRAVRNLGATPTVNSHLTEAGKYYDYNPADRTIEVYLTGSALRAFSNRELAPHHERSVVNRPYRKFQVALQPYMKSASASCDGHFLGPGSTTESYMQLQTTDATRAKHDVTTIASMYGGNGEAAVSDATWRLPNQRELALMIVAMGDRLDYAMDDASYHHTQYECQGRTWNGRHNWQFVNDSYVLHCRTHFSNSSYAKYGYMYNTMGKQMQMLWTTDAGQDLGQGLTGFGGYLCVRDVRE